MQVGDNFSVSTNGSLTARTGNFYGNVVIYPPAGSNPDTNGTARFAYTYYYYTDGNVGLNESTRYTYNMSLTDVITTL